MSELDERINRLYLLYKQKSQILSKLTFHSQLDSNEYILLNDIDREIKELEK